MHSLDQLMKSVVRIEAKLKDGNVATGSGFAYNFASENSRFNVSAIVTNKHVIDGASIVSLPISVADKVSGDSKGFEIINLELTENNVMYHPSEEIDLCAILTTPIINYLEKKNLKPTLVHLEKETTATTDLFIELLPLEEVVMIGFPNGIWDSINNGSIARKGVIATIPENDYLGKTQFVVDMACFPGSSGSPVFLANFGSFVDREGRILMGSRVKLLGILYAGPQHTASGEIVLAPVPTQNKPMSFTAMPNNLGYVIKAFELDELEIIAEKLLKKYYYNKDIK